MGLDFIKRGGGGNLIDPAAIIHCKRIGGFTEIVPGGNHFFGLLADAI